MKTAVCCIAKNENLYIREWVEWYKNLMFDNVIIFDNNDNDGEHFEDVINDYITSGYVIIKNYRSKIINIRYGKDELSLQGAAYSECYSTYYDTYNWIAFFDVDEFLHIGDFTDIREFLSQEKFENVNGLHILWKLYGDNNKIYYEPKPVIERFMCDNNIGIDKEHFYKTILKTTLDKSQQFVAHGPNTVPNNCPEPNTMKLTTDRMSYPYFGSEPTDIYLMHFYTKSTEEFFNRKWKKTSAVTGKLSNRNNSLAYLTSSSGWGYYKTNKKTDEKTKFINDFTSGRYKSTYNIKHNTHINKNIAICCIIKNENLYIKEWVEHYINIGVDKIFIYDNNTSENPKDLLINYVNIGIVEIIDYRNLKEVQCKAYNECIDKHGKEYEWIAFFDADEYLTLNKDANITDYLNRFKDKNAVLINWRNFDDNGLIGNENIGYSIKRFKEPLPISFKWPNGMQPARHCKTILHTKLTDAKFGNSPHTPTRLINTCNSSGAVCSCSTLISPTYEYATLDHYSRKTILEYAKFKLNRGWADTNKHKITIDDFWMYNKKTPEKLKAYTDYINSYDKVQIETSYEKKTEQENRTYQSNKPTKYVNPQQQTLNRINQILTNANKQRLMMKLR